MRSARHHLSRLAVAAVTVPVLGLGLVACGGQEETPAPTETAPTAQSPAPTESPAPGTSGTATESAAEDTSETTTEQTSSDATEPEVREVAERFSSLAPASLFAQFETCDPSGLEDSWQCSGPDVGQFQFFSGSAKAASTTQLLTELRSSRVVEDTGDRVVGWSTLGSTAVITVVDNERGLVLQQMVSSDREDPEDLIYELGLAEPDAEGNELGGETTESTTSETTSTTTEAAEA